MMKQWKVWGAVFLTAMVLAGCGTARGAVVSQQPFRNGAGMDRANPKTNEETVSSAGRESREDRENEILIAYFTWADNAAGDGTDAVSSASVIPPGNAAKMAQWIGDETGGTLFSIRVETLYPSDYDECLERAAEEKAQGARPKLESHVENFAGYKTVFLGFPNWWYTLPMPVYSFLEEYDFTGKRVVPFCTHGTGGMAATIKDLEKALPESAELLAPIGVYREDIPGSQQAVTDWLGELGF